MANEKVASIGTKNGKPSIEYWRYGVAAKGEPSIVTRVEEFPDAATRDVALFADQPEAD